MAPHLVSYLLWRVSSPGRARINLAPHIVSYSLCRVFKVVDKETSLSLGGTAYFFLSKGEAPPAEDKGVQPPRSCRDVAGCVTCSVLPARGYILGENLLSTSTGGTLSPRDPPACVFRAGWSSFMPAAGLFIILGGPSPPDPPARGTG